MRNRKKRTRRRNGLVDILNGLLSITVVALIAAAGLVVWGAYEFNASGPSQEDTIFQVERGLGLSAIAGRLEEAGLISNQWLFQAGAYAMGKHTSVRAGEFEIDAGASMGDIVKEFSEGRPIQYAFTVPPGLTSWQVAQRLLADEVLLGGIEAVPPEGSILPETYHFERGTTRAELIARMQSAMTDELAEIWEARDSDIPVETPEELVILASIIEKETGLAEERPLVAGLFTNRLEQGIRLQTDPTIIYGVSQGRGTIEGGITAEQKATETPYNTYIIDGLPPTPIANPGVESLRAAANPVETDYLYMMAVTPNNPADGHVFAITRQEHDRNVARYRELEREQALEESEAARQEAAE